MLEARVEVGDPAELEGACNLYLDLMKRCLTNSIYGDTETFPVTSRGLLRKLVVNTLAKRGLHLVRRQYDPLTRREGRDWPPTAHTMVGMKRLDNLQFCVEDVLAKGVPGDLIETGVWRGGAVVFMRAILKAHGVRDRVVWAADSFRGLPVPDPETFPADAGDAHHTHRQLAVSLSEVRANFNRYGLLDRQTRFLEGWFKDTLPGAPIDRLAVLRVDGDMYESTIEALTSLYPKLSVGGYVIVDDYGAVPGCRRAVEDYRQGQRITEPMSRIDWGGVYWCKAQATRGHSKPVSSAEGT
jgi:O-methyltransferase